MRTKCAIGLFILSLLQVAKVFPQSHTIYLDSTGFKQFPERVPKDQIHQEVQGLKLELWGQGFIFAQVVSESDSTTFIEKGKKKKFSIDSLIDGETGQVISNISSFSYRKLRTEIVEKWTHDGYPFATFLLQDLRLSGDTYTANVRVDPGPLIVYDRLFLINPVKTDLKYVSRALEVQEGRHYSEGSYQKLAVRISRLPYASLITPPDVAFSNGKATIYLDISEEATNSFEGVIGLLPGQSSGDLLVTGYLDLQLRNLFNSGKEFSFVWNRFGEKSQSMELDYSHPFLLDTRLTLDAHFSLFKQDTSFVNQNYRVQLGSYLSGASTLQATYHRSTTNVLTSNQDFIQSERLADFQTDLYGLEMNANNYDWPFTFDGGFKAKAIGSIGQKKILKKSSLNDVLRDSLMTKSTIGRFGFSVKHQRPVFRQFAVFNEISAGFLRNNFILSNEAYRLGGLRSVRGFNENEIYANQYVLSRLELRQYFERSSYFMLMYDQLWYQNVFAQEWPFGLGLGFALSTKSSLFNFALAVGKAKGTSFSFSTAKIHFGYISRF